MEWWQRLVSFQKQKIDLICGFFAQKCLFGKKTLSFAGLVQKSPLDSFAKKPWTKRASFQKRPSNFGRSTHGWSAKGLKHLLGATKRAFSFLYTFWSSDYRQRFPLKSTEIWRCRKHQFCVLKFPLSPLHSTRVNRCRPIVGCFWCNSSHTLWACIESVHLCIFAYFLFVYSSHILWMCIESVHLCIFVYLCVSFYIFVCV